MDKAKENTTSENEDESYKKVLDNLPAKKSSAKNKGKIKENFDVMDALSSLKNKAYRNIKEADKPTKKDSLIGFFDNCSFAVCFILSEKENVLFAFLSVAVIAAGYFAGVQILDWIPQEIWDEVKDKDNDDTILSLVLMAWSFVCIGLVTYPLGIVTACMGASYILRANGRQSTIAECLKIVMPKSWTLWVFSWLDGWWTFMRILERLPKKNDHTPLSVKLRNEAIYQAWKIASLGFVPALVCGRSISESCADSIGLLKDKFLPLAKLRAGYSIICWIISIAAYVSMFFFMFYFSGKSFGHNEIYSFYFIAGFPIVLACTIILMIFRPLYIISACRIYASYAKDKNIDVKLPHESSKAVSSLIAFVVLLIIFGVIFLYRQELGLSDILENPHLYDYMVSKTK